MRHESAEVSLNACHMRGCQCTLKYASFPFLFPLLFFPPLLQGFNYIPSLRGAGGSLQSQSTAVLFRGAVNVVSQAVTEVAGAQSKLTHR